MKMISVVIPVYNRTWQLRRAMQSLVEQTTRQFEVIICDDGSIEDVASIVAEFDSTLPVVFLRIENSGGPARPRNMAVARARGEWISFLDSDDWWDSLRMEVVLTALNDDVDLLYHSLRLVGKDGKSIRRGMSRTVGFPIKGEPLRYMALFGNPIPASSAVVRRSMLERIGGMCEDPNLVAFEDFDAWLRLAESGARIHYLDATLGSYWIGDDAISAMSIKQIHRQLALFERHLPHFGSFKREAIARQNYTLGSMWSRVKGHSDVACDHLLRAKGLPTLVMRINRLLKYTKLRFWG
jgi:glycosyltransferase involved in cell wall biosynthesis